MAKDKDWKWKGETVKVPVDAESVPVKYTVEVKDEKGNEWKPLADASEFVEGPKIDAADLPQDVREQVFGKPLSDLIEETKDEPKEPRGTFTISHVDTAEQTVTFVAPIVTCECPVSGFNPKTGKDWTRPICGNSPAYAHPHHRHNMLLCRDHWALGMPGKPGQMQPPFPVK